MKNSMLEQNSPYISDVTFVNYKAFTGKVSVNFKGAPGVYLIIGNNAVGKTAILDGIAKCLSWITKRIEHEGGSGFLISESAINKLDNPNVTALFRTSLGKSRNSEFEIVLATTEKGALKRQKNEVLCTEEFARNLRSTLNSSNNEELPLWTYYDVERNTSIRNSLKNLKVSRVSAYENSLENKRLNWYSLIQWLEFVFDLEAHSNNLSSVELDLYEKLSGVNFENIETEINSLEETNEENMFEQLNIVQNLVPNLKNILDIVNKIENIEKTNKVKETINLKSKEVFLNCIKSFLNNITNISMEIVNSKKIILVTKDDGSKFDLNELSQGEKSILIILGDLVRRMSLLNPKMDNPLETKAVVIIDEIDLHFHPRWQTEIISKLESSFPNTQFILTTHSPFVISSVNKDNISIIQRDEDNRLEVSTPQFQSRGSSFEYNLENLQYVLGNPLNIKEYQNFKEFLDLISMDQEESEIGQNLRESIINHFGENHPYWFQIKQKLFLKKMKNR